MFDRSSYRVQEFGQIDVSLQMSRSKFHRRKVVTLVKNKSEI